MVQQRIVKGYCIDTSALIDMWRVHYPEDVFPALWVDIGTIVRDGILVAPVEVLDELERKDDELLAWARTHAEMCLDLSAEEVSLVGEMVAAHLGWVDLYKETPDADPFIVALARTRDLCVVTAERMSAPTERPRIPNICRHYRVECINPVELFRQRGWRYGD